MESTIANFNMELVGTIWPTIMLWIMNFIFLPLYIFLLISILVDRLKSPRFCTTFHNLVISLALADILGMLNFTFTNTIRESGFFSDFYWDNRNNYWVSAWGYNNVYYFLFLRCFGAALISIQRYLTVCRSHSRINELTQRLPFWKVFLLHWIPPSLYSLPIVLNTNIYYENPHNLSIVVDKFNLKLAMFTGDFFCLITFLLTIGFYLAVLRLFSKSTLNRNLRREFKISIQVLGPVFAITMAFIFYLIQFIFAMTDQNDMIVIMRSIWPAVTGFISYINPCVYLLLSDDLRKLMLSTLLCRKLKIDPSRSRTRSQVTPAHAVSTGTHHN